MSEKLRIEFEWLPHETGSEIDKVFAASIGAAVGDDYITRLEDLAAKTVRNQMRGCAWHLAAWFAPPVAFLLTERCDELWRDDLRQIILDRLDRFWDTGHPWPPCMRLFLTTTSCSAATFLQVCKAIHSIELRLNYMAFGLLPFVMEPRYSAITATERRGMRVVFRVDFRSLTAADTALDIQRKRFHTEQVRPCFYTSAFQINFEIVSLSSSARHGPVHLC